MIGQGAFPSPDVEQRQPPLSPTGVGVLAIGRKDYVIRAVHPSFGEQWNVSWSQLRHISSIAVHRSMASGSASAADTSNESESRLSFPNPQLVLGPDNTLRLCDSETGWVLWSRKFSTPPLAAYPPGGPAIDLVLSAEEKGGPSPSRTLPETGGVLDPKFPVDNSKPMLAVGTMKGGGLFGVRMPTWALNNTQPQCSADGSESNVCDVDAAVGLHADLEPPLSTAVALRDQRPAWQKLGVSSEDDDVCDSELDGGVCALPLGLFDVEDQCTDSTLLYIPKASAVVARIGGDVAPVVEQTAIQRLLGYGEWSRERRLVVVGSAVVLVICVGAIAYKSWRAIRRRKELNGESAVGSSFSNSQIASSDDKKKGRKSNNGVREGGVVQRSFLDSRGAILVGRLRVGPKIIGYGSGGTVVFAGELDGRPIAVKRLLRQFVELARKEIGALIISDEHPNVVRCFAMEEDTEFVYLALERCTCTLADALADHEGRARFVTPDGHPTAFALQIAQDIGRGLEALHARGIVHRDLKPHNVLLSDTGRAKLSDMGLSKRLVPEQTSFETLGTSGGSPGWQAPEQLALRAASFSQKGSASVNGPSTRQTAAVDVFSFGLLIHYCLTGGRHPYGEGIERDAAILKGIRSLSALANMPEAEDLVQAMLSHLPNQRPSVQAVMAHPLWWSPSRRLSFLIDVSDRVEGEDRAEDDTLYAALEALSTEVVGSQGSWASALDSGLLTNLGKYRRYDYGSVRDLLRVVRNKHSHFRDMPSELQARLGPIPDGFLAYFASRFPRLLVTCYYFGLQWCADEPVFAKYFPEAALGLLTTAAPAVIRDPAVAAAAQAAAKARLEKGPAARVTAEPLGSVSPGPSATVSLPGEQVAPPVAMVRDPTGVMMAIYPRRLGMPTCEFYAKTGHCRFGEACRYDHPEEFAVPLSSKGLPIRPGQPICGYYERHGDCKFGPACRYNHPVMGPASKIKRPPGF